MSATALEGLFSSLSYFFSGDGVHINDYQLALQRCIKRGPGNAATGWKYSLSLWCLNPAVVFREIADLSLSVILTSGTLSPMNSFSSELGVQFGISLEAPHVINVDSQLWAAVISTGPGNYPLNASYKTMDGYAFQDALGTSLEEICKVVPGGSLIFFPSYKLMEKLCNRWRETGQWSRLNARKTLFVEPRGGSQEDFEPVLKGYYDSIQGRKPAIGRNRKGKKIGLTNSDSIDGKPKSKEGAAFLAVCRGKVSEGIDFSDENARVVIIVGIPFPNVNDIQVAQKKKYNDTYKSTRSLLSGNEWYCQQAFRALNQAAGRCIRHRFDFGAVILLDERFREERNIMYVSKWLRKSIRQYDSFHKSLEELETFFRDVEERIAKETANTAQDSVINVENISDMDQGKGCSKRNIVKESNKCVSKPSNNMMAIERKARLCESPTYVEKFSATSIKSKSEDDVNVQASLLMDKKDSGSSTEYMDLECSSDNISRCNEGLSTTFPHDTELSSVMKTSSPLCRYSGRISTAFSNDDIELTIVKETPGTDGCVSVPSPESFSKDETSSSTVIHGSIKFQFLQSTSLDSHLGPSKSTFPLVGTPEKSFTTDTSCLLAERDSLLNLSVNSHTQKRRKLLGLKSVSCAQAEECEANNPTTPEHLSTNASLVTAKDVNHRIEFGLVNDCSQELNKFNSPQLLAGNSFWASNTSTGDVEDKKQRIFCSLCKNPLGLPENHLYVGCSITSLSKPYLVALLKGRSETPAEKTSSCVSVAISDISSVDQRLYNKNPEYTLGQGIWCPEDGCVFKTLFCPFCSNTDNCLGVQILAADALNVHLLNKIVFYQDRLEIEDVEASKRKDSSPGGGSGLDYCSVPIPIEKFAYIPVQESSEGWRTTRTKMQLPKRRVLPTTRRWG
ncbi:RNA helicase [Bertholletia excelsa]